jgi:RNA polymerase sigma-70 factor (ECF subfamily)
LTRPIEAVPRSPLRLVGQRDASEPDDAALVEAVKAGEEWAARALWRRYAPLVYGVLDRALGSSVESEDLSQDVFSRFFASVATLRDPTALRSFLYSIAIRALRSHLRAKTVRRILRLSDTGEVPDRPVAAADNEGRDLLLHFYRVLDTLRVNDRTVFLLRQVEGLSLEEIAEITGTSLATVKRRLHRASEWVETRLGAEPDFAEYFQPSAGGK